jgi:hypothetical protein
MPAAVPPKRTERRVGFGAESRFSSFVSALDLRRRTLDALLCNRAASRASSFLAASTRFLPRVLVDFVLFFVIAMMLAACRITRDV